LQLRDSEVLSDDVGPRINSRLGDGGHRIAAKSKQPRVPIGRSRS
jgi:hypothetical protein